MTEPTSETDYQPPVSDEPPRAGAAARTPKRRRKSRPVDAADSELRVEAQDAVGSTPADGDDAAVDESGGPEPAGAAVDAVDATESSTEGAVPASEEGAATGPDESSDAAGANGDHLIQQPVSDEEDYGNQPELTTQQVIEAVLFAADTPLPVAKIVSILGVGSARDVKKHVEELNERYEREGAAFRIENIAGGYQMLTLPAYNTWLRRLKQNRQDSRLSPAALETLAVVAYRQPVVRADVEVIRGVAAGEMLNRLRELGLVKIVGRAEDVGRPMLYGTTKRFLEVFGLSSLEDLPPVEQLQAPE